MDTLRVLSIYEGFFAGGADSVQVQTDNAGNATAPAFTANSEGGPFTVIANVSTGARGIFHLTNLVPMP